MIDLNFHGIKAVDKYCLFDFPPKDGEYRKGVQIVYKCGYYSDRLFLIMVDSEMDSAYKLDVDDMANSEHFLSLLNGADKELILRLSRLTNEEKSYLMDEYHAHTFNSLMNLDWEDVTKQFNQEEDWFPEENQYHFDVFSKAKRKGDVDILCHTPNTLPNPKMALDILNSLHNKMNRNVFIQWGMSL